MNYINKIILTCLTAIVVSGCGTYSKFNNTVDQDVVDELYSYIEANQDTTSMASLSWKQLFTDPKLQALIALGLENNSDLKVARLSVEQAEIVLKQSRLNFTPTLDLSGSASVNSFNNTTTRTYSISASSSWEIDLFGKLRNAKEQSRAALEQSRAYEQGVQTALISTIATNYFSLLLLDKQLEISHETLQNWSNNIRTMEALKRAGRLNSTSVLQSKASSVALEKDIVSLEEQIAELENSLCALLGIVGQPIERGLFADSPLPEKLSAGLPLQMVSKRPDVRMAEYALMGAFYATAEARSSLYPSLTLGGTLGFTNGTSGIVNPGEMLFNAVASLLQPIFNRGALRAQLNISKLQQEQALIGFNQALLDAGAEVNTALIEWQSARERIGYDQTQMELLTKALRSSELLMRHGNVNYLEVLTAQMTLLQAELSYTTNRFGEIMGVINLYRALGGGAE